MKRALAVLVLLCASRAQAAPLVDPSIGGMVFTGPTSAHASALYWNPAAAGLMRGWRVYVAGQLHNDFYEVDRTAIDADTGEPNADVQGTSRREFGPAKGWLLAPGGIIAGTNDFGSDTLTIGLAVHMPTGDMQPENHDQLRYHTLGGSLQSITTTVGVSYRLSSEWIAGASLSGSYSWAHLRFAFDQQLEGCTAFPCNVENPQYSSEFDIVAHTSSRPDFSFSGGLMWKAREDLWFGFAYHSPPGFAGISMPGNVTVLTAPDPALGERLVHGDAEVNLSLPHILQVGARWDVVPTRWQLLASARWATLSALDQLDVRLAGPELREAEVREWMLRYRGLADAWQFEAGLETPAGQATRWGLRARFDTGGAAKTHVAPEQITGPTFDFSGGFERVLWGGLSLTFAASAGFMVPRHVGESVFQPAAQTECVASGYNLDDCRAAREGSAIPTAAGDYERYNFGAMLGLTYESL
jgi:long-subunit fatty acid transport protein